MKIRLKELNHAHSFLLSSAVEGTTLGGEHFLAEMDFNKRIFSIYLNGKEILKQESVPRSFEYCDDRRGSIHQLLLLCQHYKIDLEEECFIEAPPFDLIQLNENDLTIGLPVYHPISQQNNIPNWEYGHDLGIIKNWKQNEFGEIEVYFVCQNNSKPVHYPISNLWIII